MVEEAEIIQDNRSEEEIIREGFFFAVISYVSFLCILAFLFKKNNKFSIFHAKQGLVLFVTETIAVFISKIFPLLGIFLYKIIMFFCIVFSVWGFFSALMGKYKKLPLIGNIAEKIII